MKRYDVEMYYNGMVEDKDGDYVLYKDVVKLEEIAKELLYALELVRLDSSVWHCGLSEEVKLEVANAIRKATGE